MVKDSMRASFILGQWRAYHIPLVNLLTVLVFQPRKLADGSGIDLVSVCIIEYKIAPIQNDKAAIQPLSVVEALAPEFNFSHISKCLKVFQSFAMFCIESRCFTNSNS